jgi:peptidoglycan hydrolase-like protein with peptidoglycan-binding domain
MLATQTARVWPDDEGMAKYVTQAGNSTAWCGIYIGWKLSRWSMRPPLKDHGVGGWMYVDAWKGHYEEIDPAQRQDGDIALWWKPGQSPHHIAFCWKGRYLGGNQNNTVNISNFRTPDTVLRPPPPESYTPQPEHMPMLMIESSGDAVRTLQTMLNEQISAGLTVDGEFGPATEQAVKTYQAKYNLEVDGIVGQQTWESLFDHDKPVPPAEPELLTSDQIVAIMNMAKDSAIANYQWKSRGKAPIGYTEGLAVIYAQMVLKLAANDSAAIAMSNAIGSHSKDALAHYGVTATGREAVLRKLFVMLYGLGMRESSGNYTEGRDVTATNVTADTCEAGLFQQSWNSSNASNEMKKLLPAYQGNKQPCHAQIFKQGITLKQTKSYGTGPGFEFQELAKSCPAFATEMCAVGLRVLYNHWGPIVRQEAEMRAEAEALLLQVDAYLQDMPEPEPPTDEIAEAKARCMRSIEAAVDRLITDLVGAKPSKSMVQTTLKIAPMAVQAVQSWTPPVGDIWPVEVREDIVIPESQGKIDQEMGHAIGEAIFDSLIERLARSRK